MVKNEYLRFLQTLNAKKVSSGVRKIANLVFEHLDEIHPLGTAQGKRAKKIAELASKNWDELSDVIKQLGSDENNALFSSDPNNRDCRSIRYDSVFCSSI